ncbi:MAG: polysaccharide biosynthesis tyrosine autokinase [Candidatus Gygaella obscura]|nr:polysaccharide biosynthesis tyrosine autokinase [Candidatus Gygaella obscura]
MDQDIQIQDYWRIIKNRKNIALVFFFTVVTIVTIGSFLMTPVYRATVTLFVDIESPNVLTTTGSVSLGNINYYAYKEYFQSQIEIIKSRSIVRRVFDKHNLKNDKDYKKTKDPLEKFLKTIKTEPIRDTRLLLLHVDNRNPQLAAEIANDIAKTYVIRNLAYITKSEVMNLHKNEYLKLQAKLAEYSKIYKEKHPKMIRLLSEIKQMEETIQKEKQQVGGYDTDTDLHGFQVSSSSLSGLKANNISIQDPAVVPVKPIKPKKRLNILLSMIIGLFGGIGLVFMFEYLDYTVKEVEDLERLVKWPFLGYIPKISLDKKISDKEKDLFVKNNPKDPIAENYRVIRTGVLFSSTEEHSINSILITSPGPQEGKTITLCNLGITLAQNRSKVLLVDADMRRPRLYKTFDINNDVGLSSFLSGQTAIENIIQKTKIDNLDIVCAGHHPPDPSELLSSKKLKEFIDFTKQKYDFVLFDTAPISVVADATILSRFIDGVVIVVESGKTNRNVLPRISQSLEKAKARIIGVVLNSVNLSGSDYKYHAYYYGK